MSQIFAAHILSSHFQRNQSFGDLLGSYMMALEGDNLIKGYSYYNAEECHEKDHGNGTCQFFDHRDGNCISKFSFICTKLYLIMQSERRLGIPIW